MDCNLKVTSALLKFYTYMYMYKYSLCLVYNKDGYLIFKTHRKHQSTTNCYVLSEMAAENYDKHKNDMYF